MVGKSSDTRSCTRDGLSGRTSQDKFYASELSSSLRKITFSEHEFSASKLVSDIKYHHLSSQNNNVFHPFNDQLDYSLGNYYEESKTTKGYVDIFLSNPLMAPFTEKLSYQNTDE